MIHGLKYEPLNPQFHEPKLDCIAACSIVVIVSKFTITPFGSGYDPGHLGHGEIID